MKKSIISLCLTICMLMFLGTNASAQSIQPRSEYDLCYVNTDGGNLNCRSGPGTEYSIVGKFSNGTQLTWSVFGDVDSNNKTWTKVSGIGITGKRVSGWCQDDYLLFVSPSRNVPAFYINSDMPDVG